eukprot:5779444-Pleurochrysis_carterae.AAC.2
MMVSNMMYHDDDDHDDRDGGAGAQVRTSRVFVRDSSMVTPFPLLLFGGEITVQHARQTISGARMTLLAEAFPTLGGGGRGTLLEREAGGRHCWSGRGLCWSAF